MKLFRVYFVAEVGLNVQAETEEEAEALALEYVAMKEVPFLDEDIHWKQVDKTEILEEEIAS